jgi:hypothetical protein
MDKATELADTTELSQRNLLRQHCYDKEIVSSLSFHHVSWIGQSSQRETCCDSTAMIKRLSAAFLSTMFHG